MPGEEASRLLIAESGDIATGTVPKLQVGHKTFGLVGLVLLGCAAWFSTKAPTVRATGSGNFLERAEVHKDGDTFEEDGKMYKYDCRPTSTYVLQQTIHNNFGNAGPDAGEEGITLRATRHKPAWQCPDGDCVEEVHVEMHSLTPYSFENPGMNGLNGKFTQIALRTGDSAKVELTVRDVKTGEILELPFMPMSLYDIDENTDGSGQEYVKAFGVHTHALAPGAEIVVSDHRHDGFHEYRAQPGKGMAPNPRDPDALTPNQKKRSISFNFIKPKRVTFEIGSSSGPAVRVFSFDFENALSSCNSIVLYDITSAAPTSTAAPTTTAAPAVCKSGEKDGYKLKEVSLEKEKFDVSATCADGFEGTAQVLACAEPNGQYVVKGCHPVPKPTPVPVADACEADNQDTMTMIKCNASALIMGTILVLLLVLLCLYCFGHGKWIYRRRIYDIVVPSEAKARKDYAKAAMQKGFEREDAFAYRCGLELALEAGVPEPEIPLVMQLTRDEVAFQQLSGMASKPLKVELCFVLDYTGSMKVQIEQARQSVTKVLEELKDLKIPGTDRGVDLMMTAVCYNDWDPDTKKKGRPVVSVFGGGEVKQDHSDSLTAATFQLGGQFTSSAADLQAWIKQDLGHGGKIPEELTGGLLAACNLPWTGDCRIAVVITDAPCHGKDYHSVAEDSFVNQSTGLSCTGRPEEALKMLKAKKVDLCVFHTNQNVSKMLTAFKKVMPDLHEAHVPPPQTAHEVVQLVKAKMTLRPLKYTLGTYGIYEHEHDPHPCGAHTLEVKTDDSDIQRFQTSSDGMLWIGFVEEAKQGKQKVLVNRPADASLDKCFPKASGWSPMLSMFNEGHAAVCEMPLSVA